jgi:ParB-like chromosome segregation protein Spo0J
MAREEAITRLPLTYQRLLAWIEEGRSREEIAAELDIDVQAVESLEHLARAKLVRLAGPAPRVMPSRADDHPPLHPAPNPPSAGRSAPRRSPDEENGTPSHD